MWWIYISEGQVEFHMYISSPECCVRWRAGGEVSCTGCVGENCIWSGWWHRRFTWMSSALTLGEARDAEKPPPWSLIPAPATPFSLWVWPSFLSEGWAVSWALQPPAVTCLMCCVDAGWWWLTGWKSLCSPSCARWCSNFEFHLQSQSHGAGSVTHPRCPGEHGGTRWGSTRHLSVHVLMSQRRCPRACVPVCVCAHVLGGSSGSRAGRRMFFLLLWDLWGTSFQGFGRSALPAVGPNAMGRWVWPPQDPALAIVCLVHLNLLISLMKKPCCFSWVITSDFLDSSLLCLL